MDTQRRRGGGARGFVGVRAGGDGGRADQDRLQHDADRRPGGRWKGGPDRHADLGEGHQRRRRAAEPSGRAGLLRRPYQRRRRAGHLRQAARRRQGRSGRVQLRHQPDRPGDAHHHAQEARVPVAFRPRRERQVQVRPLLPDHAVRPGAEGGLVARLLRTGDGAEPEADDDRASRHRFGVRQERRRRRPDQCQAARHEHRLRQDLPARHGGFLADHAGDSGHQAGSRLCRQLSSGLRRHGARGKRARPQGQDVRRRHGRPAVRVAADQAGLDAERHRQLRLLGARADPEIRRRRGVPREIPGRGREGGRRSAGVLPAAVRVCLSRDPRPGGERGR